MVKRRSVPSANRPPPSRNPNQLLAALHADEYQRIAQSLETVPASDALAIGCACAGAVFGYLAFALALRRGIYAVVFPGGFLGLAAGIPRNRSPIVAVLCGIFATAASLLTEYRFAPFVADDGLRYFLLHMFDLRPLTSISIAVGGLIGFWVPFRRRISAPSR
jgi:hypothetical protein